MSIIIDNQNHIKRIYKYAVEHARISYPTYNARSPCSPKQVKLNAFYGKIAELAIYNYLKDLHPTKQLTQPDVNIYKRKNVGHTADITFDHKPIHVKSFLEDRWGTAPSWVYEKTADYIGKDTYAFCVIEKLTGCFKVDIMFVDGTKFESLFKPLRNGATGKTAIYAEDINASHMVIL